MGADAVVDDVRERLKAEPFRPFFVLLPEDRRVRVFQPEFVRVWPGGRMLAYESETNFHIVDLAHATGVEDEAPAKAKKSAAAESAKKSAAKKKPAAKKGK